MIQWHQRWTTAQLEAEPPAKRAAFRWMAYLKAIGADELLTRRAELTSLITPAPKDEAAQNAVRMKSAKALRDHIAAVEDLIYPPDEDATDG